MGRTLPDMYISVACQKTINSAPGSNCVTSGKPFPSSVIQKFMQETLREGLAHQEMVGSEDMLQVIPVNRYHNPK